MLALTPAIEGALRWFDATHELEATPWRVSWRRVGLPGPGSISEQDPKLMDALDALRDVHDDLVRPKVKTKSKDG